ncbi:MAG: hypothetical protein IJW40_03640 [Clostridia bacterium]|nr:hypothetical protein [Clostridia bacterium]
MNKQNSDLLELHVDWERGVIDSLMLGGQERTAAPRPLFAARLRHRSGEAVHMQATQARSVKTDGQGAVYSDFGEEAPALSVRVSMTEGETVDWYIRVDGVPTEYAVEWVDFPQICLPRLIECDTRGGRILLPYNEGVLISNDERRARGMLPHMEPEYPSLGAYAVFPNMICSQFLAYLYDDVGLYIGAHDPQRAPKGIDFYTDGDGILLQMRLFCGTDFGQAFAPSYPIVWRACEGRWESAAEIYRAWFEMHLPPRVIRTAQNPALPAWYEDAPLVVTYPVRGIHDMDEMTPNALFPYVNALPVLEKIKRATDSRIMALLMHWEGTAPWAPPYVWPPYGGEVGFFAFRDRLHQQGDLLGVYCSGFGYTLQSNLIESYCMEKELERRGLLDAMCHSPAGEPQISKICTGQRKGYDICPACESGRELLMEAYAPLFECGIDYAQILDQNHGGGQYLCYARHHGHPAMPGAWMTENMQSLLGDWNERAAGMLFGCESAAAEPFIGNLAMSDNRFELNYAHGTPVPLYAYIYHEYVRNFMGNQCCCTLSTQCDTLRYRLAYAFSIGDLMTLTLSPNGALMTHWGTRDFAHAPDMEKTLTLIKNLTKFYREQAKEYLYDGRMCQSHAYECGEISIPLSGAYGTTRLPRLLLSAFCGEGGKVAHIVVNPEDVPVALTLDGCAYTVPALDALLILV